MFPLITCRTDRMWIKGLPCVIEETNSVTSWTAFIFSSLQQSMCGLFAKYLQCWASPLQKKRKSYLMSHCPHRKQEGRGGGGLETETKRKRKLSLFLPNCPRVTLLIRPSATRYGASLQAASSVLPGEAHEKAMKGLVWQGPARLDQLTGFFCALTRHTAVCNSSMVWDSQTS